MIIVVFAVLACFSLIVFFGAPYLPVFKKPMNTALDLLDLSPGETLLELGSGDGRVLKAAAKRGIYAVGYELNPVLVIFSYFNCFRYRKNIKIKWGNYWHKKWPKPDGIYVFLYIKYMPKLDRKIKSLNRSLMLASVAYEVPGKKPIREKDGVFLYKY